MREKDMKDLWVLLLNYSPYMFIAIGLYFLYLGISELYKYGLPEKVIQNTIIFITQAGLGIFFIHYPIQNYWPAIFLSIGIIFFIFCLVALIGKSLEFLLNLLDLLKYFFRRTPQSYDYSDFLDSLWLYSFYVDLGPNFLAFLVFFGIGSLLFFDSSLWPIPVFMFIGISGFVISIHKNEFERGLLLMILCSIVAVCLIEPWRDWLFQFAMLRHIFEGTNWYDKLLEISEIIAALFIVVSLVGLFFRRKK